MRRMVITAILCTVVLCGWARLDAGETASPAQPVRLELDLADGSRVVGVPKAESVLLQTSYAKMDIPLKGISTLQMDADHETAAVNMRNGDKLKGVDGKVTDESGKGCDGVINGARWVPDGRHGGALQFDGVDDYVTHSARSLGPDGSPYSVSLWFKTTSSDPTAGQFLLSGDSPEAFPQNAGDLSVHQRSVYFGAHDRDQRVHSRKDSVDTDTWCHVVGVAEGKTRRLYVNGELVDTRDQPNNAQWHTARLIGKRYLPGTFFRGLIDEVMIFDRALSADEVGTVGNSQP